MSISSFPGIGTCCRWVVTGQAGTARHPIAHPSAQAPRLVLGEIALQLALIAELAPLAGAQVLHQKAPLAVLVCHAQPVAAQIPLNGTGMVTTPVHGSR